jgi:hypothetical protein
MDGMYQLTKRVSEELAAKLSELQGDRTDAEMGALLGVTRVHYAHIKAGRRQMSYATVKRAALHFPELYPIVVRDLTSAPCEAAS